MNTLCLLTKLGKRTCPCLRQIPGNIFQPQAQAVIMTNVTEMVQQYERNCSDSIVGIKELGKRGLGRWLLPGLDLIVVRRSVEGACLHVSMNFREISIFFLEQRHCTYY